MTITSHIFKLDSIHWHPHHIPSTITLMYTTTTTTSNYIHVFLAKVMLGKACSLHQSAHDEEVRIHRMRADLSWATKNYTKQIIRFIILVSIIYFYFKYNLLRLRNKMKNETTTKWKSYASANFQLKITKSDKKWELDVKVERERSIFCERHEAISIISQSQMAAEREREREREGCSQHNIIFRKYYPRAREK